VRESQSIKETTPTSLAALSLPAFSSAVVAAVRALSVRVSPSSAAVAAVAVSYARWLERRNLRSKSVT